MKKTIALFVSALVAALTLAVAHAQEAPFGGPDSVKYSQKLWNALKKAGMVGPGAIVSKPYKGTHPHGAVLDTIQGVVKVGMFGHSGLAIVKRNYGGEGVGVEQVAMDHGKHLKAVTVMFKREAGYDEDNQNWFWAKYTPDGGLDKNPAGMQLAGRVAKGKPMGCIACHSAAPGGDYRFIN